MTPLILSLVVFVATAGTLRLVWLARRTAPVAVRQTVFAERVQESAVAGALGNFARPSNPDELDLQRRDLQQAGFRAPSALTAYLAARTSLALFLPALAAILWPPKAVAPGFMLLFSCAAVGYYLPWLVVKIHRDARQQAVGRVLPDVLDMLVSCLDSGLALHSALRYVSREIAVVAPEFADELDLANGEINAGVPRGEALTHMEQRCGVQDVTDLVGVLEQAERYGSGIAESVRVHAQLSRKRRILDAERRAAEAAPKLTVVMILFVLPPLFVVLIGPTIVHVVNHVIPMLEGK